jgi:fumigaclavine B O-acetyltransferase
MGSITPQSEGISPIDSLLPFLYIRFQLYFPVKCNENIVSTLTSGVQRLLQIYPVLSGYICQDLQHSVLDEKIIIPDSENFSISKVLRVKHHGKPFEGFAQCHITPDSLMFLDIAPDPTQPAPLLGIQLNDFTDSLVLAFTVTHRAIDATGLGTLITTLAHCCDDTGEAAAKLAAFSSKEQTDTRAALSSIYPKNIIPISLPQYVFTEIPDPTPTLIYKNAPELQTSSVSRYITIPATKILDLKKNCLDLLTHAADANIYADCHDPSSSADILHLSSNDVVSALLWLCITRARLFTSQPTPDQSEEGVSVFGMAVNIRRRLSPALPDSYLGNAAVNLKLTKALQEILPPASGGHETNHTETISRWACHIRQELNTINNDYVRSLLAVAQSYRSTPIRVGGHYDVCCSNLRGIGNLYESFGSVLGRPEHVVTTDAYFDGGCYILPKRVDKGAPWDIHVTLKPRAMEWILRDSLFRAYFDDHPFL